MEIEILFQVSSPLQPAIYLDVETWQEHVQLRHREISAPAVISEALQSPDVVYPGNTKKPRYVYFRLGGEHSHPKLYVSVMVAVASPAPVITAFIQDGISGVTGGPLYVRPTRR